MPEARAVAMVWAAALLMPERVFYVWLTRAPGQFRGWCAHVPGIGAVDAVTAVRWLFALFKVVQVAVLAWWCRLFDPGHLALTRADAVVVGAAAIAAGQALNFSAFHRLGVVGILYGGQLGRAVPRNDAFPYSVFTHPQYVGVVLSIWGLCLMLRFPDRDWWMLPAIETAYYALGARCERGPD